MEKVFSKNGIPIRLPDERWAHITDEHCEMAGLRLEVLETVANPTAIFAGNFGEFIALKKVTGNKFTEATLLALILFSIFTIVSYIFSVGYPFIKAMTGIGLPLVFYLYDPYTGLGINLGSFFLWQFLLTDIIYWLVISILAVWIHNKFRVLSNS